MAAEAETGFAIHPMDQFIVSRWFCHDDAGTAINECTADIKWYEITNVTVWMAITVLAIIARTTLFLCHCPFPFSFPGAIGRLRKVPPCPVGSRWNPV